MTYSTFDVTGCAVTWLECTGDIATLQFCSSVQCAVHCFLHPAEVTFLFSHLFSGAKFILLIVYCVLYRYVVFCILQFH